MTWVQFADAHFVGSVILVVVVMMIIHDIAESIWGKR